MDNLIAQIIKSARLRKSWSQRKLANEIGVTDVYISKLERGNASPSDRFSIKLAKKLEIDERNFLMKVQRERVALDIRAYLPIPNETYPDNIDEDKKELLKLYDELDSCGKKQVKNLASLIKEYIYRRKS